MINLYHLNCTDTANHLDCLVYQNVKIGKPGKPGKPGGLGGIGGLGGHPRFRGVPYIREAPSRFPGGGFCVGSHSRFPVFYFLFFPPENRIKNSYLVQLDCTFATVLETLTFYYSAIIGYLRNSMRHKYLENSAIKTAIFTGNLPPQEGENSLGKMQRIGKMGTLRGIYRLGKMGKMGNLKSLGRIGKMGGLGVLGCFRKFGAPIIRDPPHRFPGGVFSTACLCSLS